MSTIFGGDIISKEQYIIKTLTFIANSIFINIFAKVFGMSNSIVAVSIVVIALTLVCIDLRENIFKKTIYISVIMLIIGTAATLININPILGLIINLPIIFFLVHEGISPYKENMYFPFLLAYVFMALSAPATLKQLPIRLISIAIGCFYILIVQLVLNRNRFNKTIFYTKKQLISKTINQVDCILEGNCKKFSSKDIYNLTQPIVRAVYDTRLRGKVVPIGNKSKLSLVLCLENIYIELCSLSDKTLLETSEREFLKAVKHLLKNVYNYFYENKDKDFSREEIVLSIKYLNISTKDEHLKRILEFIKELPETMKLIEDSSDNNHSKDNYIKNAFKSINTGSIAFKFAIKLSVTVSTIIFLTDIFNITYGRWIIFPVIAIMQPCFDGTIKKAVERVSGTLLGIVLFTIIFTIVKDNGVRFNLTILLAYINLFMKRYYISTSLIAVSALGSVAMGGAGVEIFAFRIGFTILGCIIGLVVNRYILYCTLEDQNKELVNEYDYHINELSKIKNIEENETKKYDLILKSKLIEYKIAQYVKC